MIEICGKHHMENHGGFRRSDIFSTLNPSALNIRMKSEIIGGIPLLKISMHLSELCLSNESWYIAASTKISSYIPTEFGSCTGFYGNYTFQVTVWLVVWNIFYFPIYWE